MDAKAISKLADDYAKARQHRLKMDKVAKAAKDDENELAAKLIAAMRESDLSRVGGKQAYVTLKVDDKPIVKDWAALYGYIVDNDAFDLLHKRLTEQAVKERTELGENIPGLGTYPVDKLNVGKV